MNENKKVILGYSVLRGGEKLEEGTWEKVPNATIVNTRDVSKKGSAKGRLNVT